jgi:hypothetical protein
MKFFFRRCGLVYLFLAFSIFLPAAGLAINIDISGSDVTIEDSECFLMENIETPFGTGWARFCWNSATNRFYPAEYGFGMDHLQADFDDRTIDDAELPINIDISGSDVSIEDSECFLMENIEILAGTGWARFRWNSATNMFYPVEFGLGMVHLQADFNDKTIDAPIGTGGASVGEPVEVSPSITAIVRAEPMATPSLEIQDNHDYSAGSARFEFLASAEITAGVFAISTDMWFHELSPGFDFFIYIREQGSSANKFGDLRFTPSGSVTLYDSNGYYGNIGTYEIGRVYPVKYEFDMDAGTYDVYLDGVLVVDDRAHGVVDRGVGAVLFGCGHDSDYDGYFNVDNIFVREIP